MNRSPCRISARAGNAAASATPKARASMGILMLALQESAPQSECVIDSAPQQEPRSAVASHDPSSFRRAAASSGRFHRPLDASYFGSKRGEEWDASRSDLS